jgi:endogenous inhibitor of DNA gyrase (YacG/DUF329 family)
MDVQSRADWPELPFCSPRCKSIDLGRWLGETYRIPADGESDVSPPEGPDTP